MMQRPCPDRVRTRCAAALLAAVVVLAPVGSASAQPAAPPATQPAPPAVPPLPEGTYTAAQIQLKLDSPADAMNLDNALLVDVLRRLEGRQARWLDLPGSTLSFLPYGEETPVTIRVPAGRKTRDVLDSLLDPLCLGYRIIEDERGRGVLRVVPRGELARVGRRATIEEIELLYQLRHVRITSFKQTFAAQLSEQLKRPIHILFDLTGMDAAAASRKFNDSLAGMAENTAAGLLDQFCLQGNWTWRVDESNIVILDRAKQVVHQLRRHVSIRWNDMPLDQALVQISNSAGVAAQFQPGMMEGVEAGSRRVTWQTPDESILQIIETLSARTGITYEVREDSIYFFSARRADYSVGLVTVPSRTGKFSYQLFLRKSMLTKEAQAALDQQLKAIIDAMNRELTGTGSANPPAVP